MLIKTTKSFNLNVSDKKLDEVYRKVAAYPWAAIADLEGWEAGTNKSFLQELCDYWLHEFDWRKQEAQINTFDHFKSDVDGLDIHYII